MWAETRERFGDGGPFLFGAMFGAADAMYAPVVTRFLDMEAADLGGDAGLLRRRARLSAGRGLVRAAAAEPDDWLLPDYETAA